MNEKLRLDFLNVLDRHKQGGAVNTLLWGVAEDELFERDEKKSWDPPGDDVDEKKSWDPPGDDVDEDI